MEEAIRSNQLIDHGHIAHVPEFLPVTTGDRFVVFCGHGVSPSSPGDKILQVFGGCSALAYASPKKRRLTVSPIGTSGPRPKRSGIRVPSCPINGKALARRASASGPVANRRSFSQCSTVWITV